MSEKEIFLNDINQLIREINQLRRFQGEPDAFWAAFLDKSSDLCGADYGSLLIRSDDAWRCAAAWPQKGAMDLSRLGTRLHDIAQGAVKKGFALESGQETSLQKGGVTLASIRLDMGTSEDAVVVFLMEGTMTAYFAEAMVRLQLVTDVPSVYVQFRSLEEGRQESHRVAGAMDLMVQINDEVRYVAATMTLCNEIASRFKCSRVGLGWLENHYVRLKSLSHVDKFEKKMDAVQALETAMEEALDQDEEILLPGDPAGDQVVLAHGNFSRKFGGAFMVSVPLRLDGESVGCLSCERSEAPFSEGEVLALRVVCDMVARRMNDLYLSDRWVGARAAMGLRRGLSGLWGVEHTVAKIIGILISLALAILLFGTWPYRLEAPCILKTDALAYLPAPFDGYIDEVEVEVGDSVDEGHPLFRLDTRELFFKESSAIADENRFVGEADKARAQGALADMNIALARKAQARARLDQIRFLLAHSRVNAPFKGIVVEGEKKELLGAPVRKGDILFKVARLENLYVELSVDERDIHELKVDAEGDIAFTGRPDLKFPIRVERITPMADAKEDGNYFMVKAVIEGDAAFWWRPGMSGIGKIRVGRRPLIWLATHRTLDFLRMNLWW